MNNEIYIGIDPSINSTGVCVMFENNIQFYIIKPGYKLTKKEQYANNNLNNFEYIFYRKYDLKEYKDNNHLSEYYKTKNFMNIIKCIKEILYKIQLSYNNSLDINNVHIVIEGISYGSVTKTKAIFDLAGLNYMIRYILLDKYDLIIATPSEIKKFATGNGNSKKEVINDLFLTIFPEYEIIPKIDDVSDAYMMCNYGVKYINKKEDNI